MAWLRRIVSMIRRYHGIIIYTLVLLGSGGVLLSQLICTNIHYTNSGTGSDRVSQELVTKVD